jgi:hypothetical protein
MCSCNLKKGEMEPIRRLVHRQAENDTREPSTRSQLSAQRD